MSLVLYYHPLSSYCHKVLIALYENATPFTPHFVDLGKPESRKELTDKWPLGKLPVLVDKSRDWVVPESSIIIEYLGQHYPGPVKFLPVDADRARQVRSRDRFYDLHIDDHLFVIAGHRLRPEDKRDPFGLAQTMDRLRVALDLANEDLAGKTWAMGEEFSLADCAAAPALFYTNMVMPFYETHKNAAAYLERMKARPSYARTLKEAEPYLHMVPLK